MVLKVFNAHSPDISDSVSLLRGNLALAFSYNIHPFLESTCYINPEGSPSCRRWRAWVLRRPLELWRRELRLLVGPPKPNKSKGTSPTKRNPMVLQYRGLGTRLATLSPWTPMSRKGPRRKSTPPDETDFQSYQKILVWVTVVKAERKWLTGRWKPWAPNGRPEFDSGRKNYIRDRKASQATAEMLRWDITTYTFLELAIADWQVQADTKPTQERQCYIPEEMTSTMRE